MSSILKLPTPVAQVSARRFPCNLQRTVTSTRRYRHNDRSSAKATTGRRTLELLLSRGFVIALLDIAKSEFRGRSTRISPGGSRQSRARSRIVVQFGRVFYGEVFPVRRRS